MSSQTQPKLKVATPSEVKESAKTMIDQLPSRGLTWEKLTYHVGMRASIERGLAEANAGLLIAQEEIEKEFDLSPDVS